MEARLLDSLHQRLRQHELTIQATRRELLADFQQYCDRLLHDVPLHHAASVRSAIAASFLSSYPTLRPELLPPPIDSHPSGVPRPTAFQQPPSPPPASPSASAEAPARSPRERERELQGLFTPTYLPLLDDFPTLPRPADPPAPAPPPGSSRSTPLPGMELQDTVGEPVAAAADDKPGEQRLEYAALPDHPVTPAHLFNVSTWSNSRAADDTRSSISSDKSDSKPTKSALRRSSSISKPPQSPRRVRFEFMGAEVLPTTSPQPSEFIAPRPPSPQSDDDVGFSSNLGAQIGEEEDEDAYTAPPRKVSSSDALRALSRAPLDEGTVWTVVNPDDDEAASGIPPPVPIAPVENLDPEANQHLPPTALSDAKDTTKREEHVSKNGSDETPDMADSDGDDSSDDDFLAMAKTRKSKPLQTAAPTSPPALTKSNSTSHVGRQAPSKPDATAVAASDDEDDGAEGDDDMFFFEAGGLSAPPRPRPRPPLPDLEQDDEHEATEASKTQNQDGSDPHQADADDSKTSLFATSPAVPIRHASRASATVRFQPGSLGSYKGRPLMMPIVRDPEILAQANSVKGSSLRVDGIDDEVAMAEGSPPPFPSTPLSFRGRYIMEEMMESQRKEKADKEANKTEGNA
ncbi:hypothetical protein JDV02_001053 [Purpureocillium takamizusanense]|uniref:Uncharacterized protein n=1 Tax=Purpureocillium takamizusanense TaxID=2060973 RepID=A0A9Q8Q686_9HYPO|nr:uncharacterized protein JDV02_001053 [Purpureocillium takamizusanense]UNI14423.1 hypothetical protein JDV02_001053 [Purpureocillium takamizusanense]